MADLRIVDAPLIPKDSIKGSEKIPTGGSGNYSISLEGVADYAKESLDLADKTDIKDSENGVKALIKQHTDNLNNPHDVTKAQVGLANVDNTADVDKPMSNLTQSAITTLDQKKADKTSVYLKTETYNKNEVDSALANKPNSNTVYTKIETNNLLNGKVSSVNGKNGTAITLTRSDLGISSDEVMQQWLKEARFVEDESGLNQQQINNKLITTVESIADLIAITNPKDGRRVFVNGLQGGDFKFDSSLISVNNEGTVFNGWVRQYVGGVYAEWFGANSVTDTSPILEKALAVDLHVKFGSGDFIFESECGIPDTTTSGYPNYSDKKITIEGSGSTRFLIKSTDRPVFTSARSKGVNYNSRDNLFSAKIDFVNITMVGSVANAKVFNGDRLYNTFVERCNFYKIGTVLNCDVVRDGEDAPYSQSFTFSSNHFAYCGAIARVPRLYNFVFSQNMCEENANGFLLDGTTGDNGSIASARFTNNLFESGGVFIKCRKPIGLVVTGNYLEHNNMQSVTDNLCQILIDGAAQATDISGNFIETNNQTQGYTEIKYINHWLKSDSSFPLTTGMPTIANNTGGVQLLNYDAVAVMFGNSESVSSANNSLRMTSPMEAYRHSSYLIKTYTASARNPETNRLTVGFLDLTRLERYYGVLSGLMANFRIRICFGDGSNVSVGEFYADTSAIIYSSPYNSDGVIHARAKLNSFIDNNPLDFVTVDDNYAQNFGDTVDVVLTSVRKNVYKIELTEYMFGRNPQYFNISIDYDVFSTTSQNSYWCGGLIKVVAD